MNKPLVDITTLNAVQSVFRRGTRDPWQRELSGRLADLVIYGATVRIVLPVPCNGPYGFEDLTEPSLLRQLASRDSNTFCPEKYSTEERLLLKDEYLLTSLDTFAAWARANRATLSQWIKLHNEDWIRGVQGSRQRPRYVFTLDSLRDHAEVKNLAQLLGGTEDDVFYAFDVVLRFPLYGQLAGENEYYLNHPIRDAIRLPTMEQSKDKAPPIAVSFRKAVADLAPKLTQDEYAVLLHELRGQVRDRGLHKVGPGECDKEVIREIAEEVSLPPHLKGIGKGLIIAGGILTGVGAIPALGPIAALLGAAVAVSPAIWDGNLPRGTAHMKWLRWVVEWEIENQAEKRE